MRTLSKHRWFRFSLRTMFVLVLVAAIPLGWLAWQIQIVRERKAVLAEVERVDKDLFDATYATDAVLKGNGTPDDFALFDHTRISFTRKLLGDVPCLELHLPETIHLNWIVCAEAAFPEAVLIVGMSRPGGATIYKEFRDSLTKPAADRLPNIGSIFKTGLIEK